MSSLIRKWQTLLTMTIDNCNHTQRPSCGNVRNFRIVKYTIRTCMITYSYNQIINFVCETNRFAKAEIYCFSTDIFFTRPQIHSKSQPIRALTFFNCSSLFHWIHKQLMGSGRKQLNRRGKMSGIIINQFYAGKF